MLRNFSNIVVFVRFSPWCSLLISLMSRLPSASDCDDCMVCSECGPSLLTASEGKVTSPGHPGSFPSHTNCTWTIQVADNDSISLVFDSFNMGNHPLFEGDDCLLLNQGAMVSIYDGDAENGTRIGVWVTVQVPARSHVCDFFYELCEIMRLV